jgi:aminoglycoside phosphotransferase (APT) family kinase protein
MNSRVSHVKYIEGGISHATYSFRLEYLEQSVRRSEELILRMGGDRDEVGREFLALTRLHSTPIPVPRVYDMGEDMLGSAFIIMEKVEGRNMGEEMDGLAEAEHARLWRRLCDLLAAIHMSDWEHEGLAFLAPPAGNYDHVEQCIARLKRQCEDAGVHGLDPVLVWLEGNKPPSDHSVLLHGDYSPDNVVVCQGEIAAVIDWEGVSIGDPAYDLSWLLLLPRFFEPCSGWFDSLSKDLLRHYEVETGRKVRNLGFYRILRASELLLLTLMLEAHGAHRLGVNEDAEMLVDPALDLAGRCAEFIEEETGIPCCPSTRRRGPDGPSAGSLAK